ncbi:MAG: nucleotidyltransferase domain-containing protein [Planctomycetaceae bacterium]
MVSMDTIEEVGLRIGRQFNPERVILFGSHAESRAGVDSDVDLLVIMPTKRDPVDESVAIRLAIRPPFPVDLLVRTPESIERRLAIGDPFIGGILQHGKLLYEAADR